MIGFFLNVKMKTKAIFFYEQKLMWRFCVIHERKNLFFSCKNLFVIFYFGRIMRPVPFGWDTTFNK